MRESIIVDLITITLDGETPAARGAQLGAEQRESIRETVRLYLDYFADRGLTQSRSREIAESCFKALAEWALGHRIQMRAEAELEGVTNAAVLQSVLASVPVPR